MKYIVGAGLATLITAELIPGPCPPLESNKTPDVFEASEMAGLWYEYVWSPDFTDTYNYDCSMWMIMNDGDKGFAVYNALAWHTDDDVEDKSDFVQFDFDWAEDSHAWGAYNRSPEGAENQAARSLSFVDTDYYSYAIAQSCQARGEWHEVNWVVLSRDKEPPMFTRRKMRQGVLAQGLDINSLTKAKLVQCWGKDQLH